jgi:hypothetical protein
VTSNTSGVKPGPISTFTLLASSSLRTLPKTR